MILWYLLLLLPAPIILMVVKPRIKPIFCGLATLLSIGLTDLSLNILIRKRWDQATETVDNMKNATLEHYKLATADNFELALGVLMGWFPALVYTTLLWGAWYAVQRFLFKDIEASYRLDIITKISAWLTVILLAITSMNVMCISLFDQKIPLIWPVAGALFRSLLLPIDYINPLLNP